MQEFGWRILDSMSWNKTDHHYHRLITNRALTINNEQQEDGEDIEEFQYQLPFSNASAQTMLQSGKQKRNKIINAGLQNNKKSKYHCDNFTASSFSLFSVFKKYFENYWVKTCQFWVSFRGTLYWFDIVV